MTLKVRLQSWGWEVGVQTSAGERATWIPLPYTPAMMFETVVVCLRKRFPQAAIVREG